MLFRSRALVAAMREWMAAERVAEAWVVSTPEAEGFSVACGFVREEEQGIQLTLEA